MIGKRLAHYEIQEQIGQGGMGVVYRAADTQLGRAVAIKVLPEHLSQDPERLARFEREAKLLAGLNHSGIATVYGLHEQDGTRFLAMELIPGEDLAHVLQRGARPVETALSVAAQVAEALEAAHEAGVVHRDLKPSNILVTPEGRTKVLDFGLAKSVDPVKDSSPDLSQSPTLASMGTLQGVILGTAAYMSPEQARGQVVDKRSDIWSYGVILFEMLTGKPLFTGPTVSDTLAGVLKTDIDWSQLPADVPPGLTALMRRCLERDPRLRLRDIGEARIALAGITPGAPRAAAADAAPRGRGPWPAVSGGLAVLLAAAAFLILRPGPSAPPAASLRFEVPLVAPHADVWADVSPDGRQLAYVDQGRVMVRALDRTESRPMPGTEGVGRVVWSPDGAWLAFNVGPRLFKVPLAGGERTLVCTLPRELDGTSAGLSWSEPDRIRFATGDSGLWEVSAQGGDPVQTHPAPEGVVDYHNVSALPGGRGLLFSPHVGDVFDRIGLAAGDERSEILRQEGQAVFAAGYSDGHLVFHRSPENEGLWAVPFSLDALRTTGTPFLLVPGARPGAVTPGGTLVYQPPLPPRLYRLVLIDASGAITAKIGEPQYDLDRVFALAPDGSRAVVSVKDGENLHLWMLDMATGSRHRLTLESGVSRRPVFSGDGRWVAYIHGEVLQETELRIRRSDGSGEAKTLAVPAFMASVSPDGSTVVYGGPEENFNAGIFTVAAGGEPERLIHGSFSETAPALSPDGAFIAYQSNESGRDEVYVQTFPLGGGKWLVSDGGGGSPHWSPDGRRLHYVNGSRLFVTEVSLAGTFSARPPRQVLDLTGVHGVRPTADPGRFAAIVPENPHERPPGLVVWTHWTSGLER